MKERVREGRGGFGEVACNTKRAVTNHGETSTLFNRQVPRRVDIYEEKGEDIRPVWFLFPHTERPCKSCKIEQTPFNKPIVWSLKQSAKL